jgi:hypothetical protein
MKFIKAPVLFIVFNRPEETKISLHNILNSCQGKIYVSADGPRKGNLNDIQNCEQVRDIIINTSSEAQIFTNFHDDNLGCKNAIVQAVDWFFQNEKKGIIIEDDVIPSPDFFKFSELCLNRYEDNKSISAIQGFNNYGQGISSDRYFYSRGFYPWGWATWRDRWEKYKVDITSKELLRNRRNFSPAYIETVALMLDLVNNNLLDTWDYQFAAMQIIHDNFTILPEANLVQNIGVNGAHSVNNVLDFKLGKMNVSNLSSPSEIADNSELNHQTWHEYKENIFKIRIKKLIFQLGLFSFARKIKKSLGK